MSSLPSLRRGSLAALVCLVLALGCKSRVTLVPVSGKVTVGKEPVTSGQVTLVPIVGKGAAPATKDLSSGPIDSSGNYTISTGTKPGAPLGQYKVLVNPPVELGEGKKAKLPPYNLKYTTEKNTPLKIEVVTEPKQGAYDLKLDK
jgi:hypothetical protein